MSHSILIVEDDPGVADVVSHILKTEGYEVAQAERADIALAALREARPDLIVSDIMMPGMSGFTFCQRVRADTRLSQIPFIFLTARGQQADVHLGMGLGADDFLFKPFEPEDLLDAVQTRLQRAARLTWPSGGAKTPHRLIRFRTFGEMAGASPIASESARWPDSATQVAGNAGYSRLLKPALRIQALGRPLVELHGMSIRWPVTTSRDLYFFLLQYPRGLRKEQIGEAFWPDHDPDRLNGAFRSCLYRLRQALSSRSVIYEDGLYRCNRAIDCWYDIEVWEGLLDGAEKSANADERIDLLEEALTLYRGDYLEEVYADWSASERWRLRERYLLALETLAGLYANRRKLKRAVELYQGLLNEDAFREVGHRELMRCYYRQGNRSAAILQYWACVEILSEELGLSPSEQTSSLYLKIIA
ncbi:response regulator [Chloroflexota bacterium]